MGGSPFLHVLFCNLLLLFFVFWYFLVVCCVAFVIVDGRIVDVCWPFASQI